MTPFGVMTKVGYCLATRDALVVRSTKGGTGVGGWGKMATHMGLKKTLGGRKEPFTGDSVACFTRSSHQHARKALLLHLVPEFLLLLS